jgi:hypothetical protein
MTVSIRCPHCRMDIDAESEDELVNAVRAHLRNHEPRRGHRPDMTRDHILARLDRQQTSSEPPSPSSLATGAGTEQ